MQQFSKADVKDSLSDTAACIDFLEDLFDYKFPFPEKYFQLICAIPDAGAMEYALLFNLSYYPWLKSFSCYSFRTWLLLKRFPSPIAPYYIDFLTDYLKEYYFDDLE